VSAFLPILAELAKPEIYGKVPETEPSWVFSPAAAILLAGLLFLFAVVLAVWIYRRRVRKKAILAALPQNVAKRRLAALAGRPGQAAFVRELACLLREALSAASGVNAASLSARELAAVLAGGPFAVRAAGILALLAECEAILFAGKAAEKERLLDGARTALATLFAAQNGKGGAA
jgi:hypothetical protein